MLGEVRPPEPRVEPCNVVGVHDRGRGHGVRDAPRECCLPARTPTVDSDDEGPLDGEPCPVSEPRDDVRDRLHSPWASSGLLGMEPDRHAVLPEEPGIRPRSGSNDTADPRARAWTSKPDGDLQAYRAAALLAGVTEQLRQHIQNRHRDAAVGTRY